MRATVTKPKGVWALRIAAVVVVVLTAALTLVYRDRFREWARLGYSALFLASVLTNASLVPLPGLGITVIAGTVFNPWLVGLICGLGQAIGGLSGYLAGCGGRTLVGDSPSYARLRRWMRRYGALTIFVLSAIPDPIFSVAEITAGSTGMPLPIFFAATASGRILKSIVAALIGYYGIHLFHH